jgi:hypothetical protein
MPQLTTDQKKLRNYGIAFASVGVPHFALAAGFYHQKDEEEEKARLEKRPLTFWKAHRTALTFLIGLVCAVPGGVFLYQSRDTKPKERQSIYTGAQSYPPKRPEVAAAAPPPQYMAQDSDPDWESEY